MTTKHLVIREQNANSGMHQTLVEKRREEAWMVLQDLRLEPCPGMLSLYDGLVG